MNYKIMAMLPWIFLVIVFIVYSLAVERTFYFIKTVLALVIIFFFTKWTEYWIYRSVKEKLKKEEVKKEENIQIKYAR